MNLEPLAYTVQTAAVVSDTSRTILYEEMKSGKLRAVKRGSRTLILAEDLQAWLHSLPAAYAEAPRAAFDMAAEFAGPSAGGGR